MLKNYFLIKEYEVKTSIVVSIIILIYMNHLNLYKDWNIFEEGIKNITIYIAAGMIGMLGLIFAAISLLFSIIDNQLARKIRVKHSKDEFNEIFESFNFIMKHTAFQILIFFTLYFTIFSNNYLVNRNIFYIILFIVLYLFLFTIFYMVSLIKCFTNIFMAKIIFEEISNFEEILKNIKLEYYSLQDSPDSNLENLKNYILNKRLNNELKKTLLYLLENEEK